MRFVCSEGCVAEGTKKNPPPRTCEAHGTAFVYEKELRRTEPIRRVSEKKAPEVRRRGSTLKRGKGFEASDAQREKVRLMPCLACGREASDGGSLVIDPAHLWPRGKGGCDHPDCVIPLCRVISDGSGCHRLFDQGELGLLETLASSEAWAVEQAHPILVHGVSVVELTKHLAGNKFELVWVERGTTFDFTKPSNQEETALAAPGRSGT